MRITVTGATGTIGTAAIEAMRSRGDRGRRAGAGHRQGAVEARRRRRAPVLAASQAGSPARRRRSRTPTRCCTCWESRSTSAGATRPSARSVTPACSVRGRWSAVSAARRRRATAPRVLVSQSAVGYYGPHGDERARRVRAGRAQTSSPESFATGSGRPRRRPTPASGSPARAPAWSCPRGRGAGQDAAAVQAGRRRPGRRRAPVRPVDPPRRRGRRDAASASTMTARRAPVNLSAPSPVTNAELSHALGRVLRRPAFCRCRDWRSRRCTARWR